MTVEQRDAFLRGTRIAILGSLYDTGAPTAIPVWFDWDGESATVFTSATSEKIRRLKADPRACLTVAEPVGAREAWVTIEGEATIEESGGIELARQLAARYYTPERVREVMPSWEAMASRWVVIRIRPTRIRSVAPGG